MTSKSITQLSDLTPDDRNANAGTPRGRGLVETSLQKYGAGRSILVDRNGKVIAGNKTSEAAAAIGLEGLVVVQTTGNQLVVVQRTDLDLDEDTAARELAIADNRAGELGLEWNVDVLTELSQEIDLSTFFTKDEIGALLDQDIGSGGGDEAPDVQDGPTRVQPGELWQLGRHRLLCGDSTDATDMARLMGGAKADMVFTDPPYGVAYEGGTTVRDALQGDKTPDLYEPALRLVAQYSTDKVAVYLWHSDSKSAAVSAAVSAAGFERRCTIIWNKNQAQFGALGAQYKTKHEPAYYLYKRGKSPQWFGPTNETTVWDIDRASSNDDHPTQKPVGLAERAIGNSSQRDHLVFDGFLGSGSTLIACERTGRRCYGIEIEPKYCDVILKRFTAETGIEPERIDG